MKKLLVLSIKTTVNSLKSKNKNLNKVSKIKKRLLKIDFKRDKLFLFGKVIGIYHTSFTKAKTCLIEYLDGDVRLILCPYGLKVGCSHRKMRAHGGI